MKNCSHNKGKLKIGKKIRKSKVIKNAYIAHAMCQYVKLYSSL